MEEKDIQDAIDVLVDDEAALKDNLCAKKHCGAGKECRVNENGVAECVCMQYCPEEKDPRRMVSFLFLIIKHFSTLLLHSSFLLDLQQSKRNMEFRLWTLPHALFVQVGIGRLRRYQIRSRPRRILWNLPRCWSITNFLFVCKKRKDYEGISPLCIGLHCRRDGRFPAPNARLALQRDEGLGRPSRLESSLPQIGARSREG